MLLSKPTEDYDETNQPWWIRPYDELRALPLQQSLSSAMEKETRQTFYRQSKANEVYV